MNIDVMDRVPARSILADDLWDMYSCTFDEINKLAAQRHMMFRSEFDEMIDDPRIDKYIAREPEGVLGFGVQTRELDAWHLISPQFFAHHWPRLYAEQRIWYVGFVGVASAAQGSTLFRDLIVEMSRPVVEAHGMNVMDSCTYNVAVRRLPLAVQAILRRAYGSTRAHLLDSQQFWGYTFS